MTLDFSCTQPRQHTCRPPEILTWGDPAPRPEKQKNNPYWFSPPTLVERLPEGTRFHCTCGVVWVVVLIPGGHNARVAWTDRWEWHHETRLQRFKRKLVNR